MSRLIRIADWSGEKRSNVVFVHGLGGHPYDTWRRKSDDGSFWPFWLAKDIPGVAVFSLGYASPATNWLGTAMPLLDEAAHDLRLLLNSEELKTGPITFVCHSLGGLIVKSILRAANEQKNDPKIADFLSRCRRVVFIATPHTGSGMATWLEWLAWVTWPTASARNLVANTPELRDLNFGYRTLAETHAKTLRHLVYYEMVDTLLGRVVSPASADPGLPNTKPTPVPEDHITIAKPRRRDDLVYNETKGLVEHLSRKPRSPGKLSNYPLERFQNPWFWQPLAAKAIRVSAVVLLLVGLWQGIPRMNAAVTAALGTREAVTKIGPKVDEILERVKQEKGVPLEPLRAILGSMGAAAETFDPTEIEQELRAKASEFKALTNRLSRLSDDDPEVVRLWQAASEALNKGLFAEADAHLAAAEVRDLATVEELEEQAKKKRLSAAESRSERAAVALLQVNPEGYRKAATHYAEAAKIAMPADPKVAREYLFAQGDALARLGDEFAENTALQEAVEHFKKMVATADSDDPDDWAKAYMQLGGARLKLGRRQGTTDNLVQAIAAFSKALQGWTKDHAPFDWATTQMMRGNALRKLAARKESKALLRDAVDAYQASLEVLTQHNAPLRWAEIQNNLGNALSDMAVRDSGALKKAVEAYKEALKELTRDRVPLSWAKVQNNLGQTLMRLGESKCSSELNEAVDAFEEALKELTRDRVPLLWAQAQVNVGAALTTQAQCQDSTEALRKAVEAHNEALKELTRKRSPHDWAKLQDNLGGILSVLGESEDSLEMLRKAVDAHEDAQKVWKREDDPLSLAKSKFLLGNALGRLGTQKGDIKKLGDAVAAYRDGLTICNHLLALDPGNAFAKQPCQNTDQGLAAIAHRLGVVADRLVLATDFTNALSAADQAIALTPAAIWLYTSRANALMFLDRVDEARSIYFQYRGTENVNNEKSWEAIILEDFARFREKDLTHPLMDEIEEQFTVAEG